MDIITFGNTSSSTVLVQMVDDHDLEFIEKEVAALQAVTEKDLMLMAFRVGDWNRDLSPWKAPPVFGKEGFGDGAGDTLKEILTHLKGMDKTCYIGGYSLAGLFALWAVYQTDAFSGCAAVSPSVWFPGFDGYMAENDIRCGRVYLSLGDREEKTRNPVMATVGTRIREAHELLRERHVDCTLEWNEGNHFRDPDLRCAKGFAWLLGR